MHAAGGEEQERQRKRRRRAVQAGPACELHDSIARSMQPERCRTTFEATTLRASQACITSAPRCVPPHPASEGGAALRVALWRRPLRAAARARAAVRRRRRRPAWRAARVVLPRGRWQRRRLCRARRSRCAPHALPSCLSAPLTCVMQLRDENALLGRAVKTLQARSRRNLVCCGRAACSPQSRSRPAHASLRAGRARVRAR